ncbi:MAG TPA: biotin transporter BioY [Pseudomonadales bacterium]
MRAAPEPAARRNPFREGLLAVLGAAAVAAAAQLAFDLPGTDVPQTAQTFAVLVVGGLYGPGRGAAALAIYLLAGAVGLPVFADGAAGIDALLGPTGGFLIAFVPAAALAGWAAGYARPRTLVHLTAAMLGAHGLILFVGATRLALLVGAEAAWTSGVAPFLAGAAAKSVAAAIVVACARRLSGLGACRAT